MNHFYAANCCDFYKTGHRQQYPEGTTLVVSNLTPRSGKYATVPDKSAVVWMGLQYFIKDFLIETWNKSFFDLPKDKVIALYKQRMDTSLGQGSIPVDHLEALHDLGYLPIEIKALPEGTLLPIGVPAMTIHNTLPEFFWLTNYEETILSAYLWLSSTSATTAHNYRELLEHWAQQTGSASEFIDFQAHDFSFRGMSSLQSAVVSGASHLMFFKGTDTIPAIDFLERYYNADFTKELIGCSVPATEHSVMCAGGEVDELKTFQRIITEIYPNGMISIVSDTWDFWKVLSEFTVTLKTEILQRDGKVIFRPDSGNPADIVCGDPSAAVGTAEYKGAVEILWEIFGGTETSKGYKLLDSHIGLIYGDSITYAIAREILQRLEKKGFASSNIVFKVGSFTYQYTTRDTWGWAMKATYVEVKGEKREIFKKPKTDSGSKTSAKGLLFVAKDENGVLKLEQGVSWKKFNSPENLLATVFKDGKIIREETLGAIRARCKNLCKF